MKDTKKMKTQYAERQEKVMHNLGLDEVQLGKEHKEGIKSEIWSGVNFKLHDMLTFFILQHSWARLHKWHSLKKMNITLSKQTQVFKYRIISPTDLIEELVEKKLVKNVLILE